MAARTRYRQSITLLIPPTLISTRRVRRCNKPVGSQTSRGGAVLVDQSAEEVAPVQMFARVARVEGSLATVGRRRHEA
jgi:hypothetical protein